MPSLAHVVKDVVKDTDKNVIKNVERANRRRLQCGSERTRLRPNGECGGRNRCLRAPVVGHLQLS